MKPSVRGEKRVVILFGRFAGHLVGKEKVTQELLGINQPAGALAEPAG
jgi:hypothetical protein